MHDDSVTSDDFFAEFADVKPLTQNDTVSLLSADLKLAQKQNRISIKTGKAAILNPLQLENVTPVKPEDYLSYQQPGIQDGVFKNLRTGRYATEFTLNITAMPLREACDAFYHAIVNNHAKGVRCMLIKHGRGENSKPFPALKKSYVNKWLLALEEVIAFHTAQPQHGGTGATYVLLKKHPDQKLINREKNRRG